MFVAFNLEEDYVEQGKTTQCQPFNIFVPVDYSSIRATLEGKNRVKQGANGGFTWNT